MIQRIRWTEEEMERVAKEFVPFYEATSGGMANLREALIHAQFSLHENRRRPIDASVGNMYAMRGQLMSAYTNLKALEDSDFQLKLAGLVTQPVKPVIDPETKSVEPVLQPLLTSRNKPWGSPAETKKKLVAIMPLPEPIKESGGSPVGKIVALAVQQELERALPVLVSQIAAQLHAQLQAQFKEQFAEQRKALIAYWETGVKVEELKEIEAPATALDMNALGFTDLQMPTRPSVACAVPKKRVLIFGAFDNQRRHYEEALSDFHVDVTKDNNKAHSVGKYDLVVVLDDHTNPATKKTLLNLKGPDNVKVVKGTTTRALEQIRSFLQAH